MFESKTAAGLRRQLSSLTGGSAGKSIRASVRSAVGAGLLALGLRRKGVLGGLMATVGAASLFRALGDFREIGEAGSEKKAFARQRRASRPSLAPAAPPAEEETGTGWAPESGEPEEIARFGPDEVFGVAGSDASVAPESGDRILDRQSMDQGLPETESFEEQASEQRVLEGSEESFPASDAPSWTPGRT